MYKLKTTLKLSKVSNSMGRDNEVLVVILSSKLSQTEQQQLAKLGQLLGARMADTFTESGTVCVDNIFSRHTPMIQSKPL